MERLRFALLCDSARLQGWHLRCLHELELVAELVGVVETTPGEPLSGDGSGLLGRYARRTARMWVAPAADLALEGAPRTAREPVDFVLRLGSVPSPPELPEARLGVWAFEHEAGSAELAFFAEVYSGIDVTRAALVVTGSDGAVTPLVEGVFRTDTRSYVASRSRIQDAIASWPARACRRVAAGDAADRPSAQVRPEPGPAEPRASFALYVARVAARRARLAWTRLFRHPQWNVGVLRRPAGTLLEAGTFTDAEVDWFPLEGKAGFLADPFAILRDGRLRVLCEFFDYRSSTGRIRALEHSADGFALDAVDTLPLSVHVSYPYVLDLPEGVFCVPEAAATGEVALFRESELSGRWSKAAVLLRDVAAVDPTVFRHDGRWWLMCTRQGPQEDAELWAWHARDLTGPWIPHVLNPVKTDVRGARPGGMPFVHDGALYRPAQDCSVTYGGRIVLQRVLRLTPAEFVEEPAAAVETARSSRFPLGPHTVTPVGDVVLVDGRRTVFVPAAFRAFLAILGRAAARRVRRRP